jgi:amino acid adenylation domain-containing protein
VKTEPSTAQLERLLKLAETSSPKPREPHVAPIELVERGGRQALSFAQQRLWFLEQLGNLGGSYHVDRRLRLVGELDRAALVRALDRLVARHETLRTTFAVVDGEPEQRIAPAETSRFHLLEQDLRAEADPEAALRAVTAAETSAPFDLAVGPLIRGRLVRMADEEHVLLLTMHHIVSDGWSMGVLARELTALYAAYRAGEADPLPPLALQYADYAAWQRRGVEGEELQRQAAYWRETLQGAPELLALPTDRPRPARPDHAGEVIGVELDAGLTERVETLSRRHGATLFATLTAAWVAVLSRLANQRDIVVGTPTANRNREEIEGLVGFFVNTLALRFDVAGSATVAELIGQVKARTLAGQQNQDIPFEQVVELAQPVRSLSHTPLFQVVFAWQNVPRARLELPGLRVQSIHRGHEGMAKFDLSLTLGEKDGRIDGVLLYATALFDRATAERYVAYFRRVVEQMVADDGVRVEDLALLSDAERAQVVDEWNATAAPYPDDLCVHELFERQVARSPDAVAVVLEDECLSYAELNARANRLAHHLRALGVAPERPVGLCVGRGMALPVGVLGILKAGGAYLPLDPSLPRERLRRVLADGAPVAVLTQASLAHAFGGLGATLLDIDDTTDLARRPATNPARAGLTPEHPVYLLYTSGSTGEPKGVVNLHRNLCNRVAALQALWELGAWEAVLQNTTPTFDVSAYELFLPWLVGARVVMTRDGGQTDPSYLSSTIARERVSVVSVVPSLLRLLLEEPALAACSDLRHLACGGEALPPALAEDFHARVPAARLYNRYGPTEAATAVVGCVSPERSWPGSPSAPIGRPVANSRAYVLNETGEPSPIGVAGELYIGGAGVGRGYLGRARATAERFVPDPFGSPGARLYRTGDRARWLADGTIDFLGRTDFQVKLRGMRVELGEIDAALAEHDAVRDVVVLAREDRPGNQRLVAYYRSRTGADVDVERLRAHLAERLPAHMIPAAYVRLATLPLTPSGKLDRQALPAPDRDAYRHHENEAPADEVEAALAEIWSALLHVETVGRHDHFFELGGHSLISVQLVSRVRQVLGVELPLGAVFRHPVLADLARVVGRAHRSDLPPIERVDRGGDLPVSFAQRRLWYLEQLGGLGSAYHMSKRTLLRGTLDPAALRRALDALVARHEPLRTTFAMADGEPTQRIARAETSTFALLEHDLREHPDRRSELRRLIAAEASAPFDLERGPLIRGRLARLAEDEHVLLVTMHHIVSDAWSIGVFTHELSVLYTAFSHGAANPLAALEVQYVDYAAWQRRWVEGDVLQRQAAYWRENLAGAPELLTLPTDRARPARQDRAGDAVAVAFGEALTADLKTLSRRHGVTLHMTVLAAWATVLGRLANQRDLVIGTSTANRSREEIEGLIGFFINALALRVDLSGSPTVAELLQRVKAVALAAQEHQDIPFDQVVEVVNPPRSHAYSPLFQAQFVWQSMLQRRRLDLPGVRLEPVGDETAPTTAKFDLMLILGDAGGTIVGSLTYATSLYERATIERQLAYLERVLEQMAADDAVAIASLDLLPAAERRLVLHEWNAAGAGQGTPGDGVDEGADDAASISDEWLQHAAQNPEYAAYLKEMGVGLD